MAVIKTTETKTDVSKFLNRQMELIILPTEKCNLDCVYCYEKFEIGMMSQEHVEAIKKLISRRVYEIDRLTIQWFGGEPLLGYPIIKDIMNHVKVLQKSNPSLFLTSNATTNGYLLTPERLSELVSLNVNDYQITFDGDKELHDTLRRKRGDNGPSFDVIWKNIIAAHNTNLNFIMTLRMHVNSLNRDSMEFLLRRVEKEIGPDKRFMAHIRFLSRLGGPNDKELPITDDTKAILDLKCIATSIGLQAPDIDIYKEVPDFICYASKPFAYVIRANGDISKCTVGLYSDTNIIGKLNYDSTMQLDDRKIASWSRGLFNGNQEDLSCPWKAIRKEELQLLRKWNKKNIPLKVLTTKLE
jgi:uncharacterized protein